MIDTNPDATDPVRRQFSAVAAAYAVSPVHASGPDLAALVEAASLTGGEDVLDLGCGAGHTALALAPLARHVVAVDLTPEMLAVAGDLAGRQGVDNIDFRLANASALPFADASFDLVSSRYSAHHYAEPQQALREAVRVLRPGGRFLLIDTVAPETPALDTFLNAAELLRDGSHVRNWTVSQWLQMLTAAGFVASRLSAFAIDLEGDAWVQRSQTPPEKIAALKYLFATANEDARATFRLRAGSGWGWSIPAALIQGRKIED